MLIVCYFVALKQASCGGWFSFCSGCVGDALFGNMKYVRLV